MSYELITVQQKGRVGVITLNRPKQLNALSPQLMAELGSALVGMNCVVNDNAEVGEDAVVAALAFVKAEDRIPPRALAVGIPAKLVRTLSPQELRWKKDNMHLYQQLAVRSSTTMREVEALTAVEPNRKRIDIPGAIPLSELKKTHEL